MSKLLLLVDSTTKKINDYEKLIEFGNSPDAEIDSSLQDIRRQLQSLSQEQTRLEQNAQIPEYRLRESEAYLIRMQRRVESAEETLLRKRNAASQGPSFQSSYSSKQAAAAPLTSDATSNKSDIEMESIYQFEGNDPNPIDVNLLTQMHQQMLNEQEESLGGIEASVRKQKQLGYLMNDELEEHNQLIDHMDDDVDRVDKRLNLARNRLRKVTRKAKQYPRCCIILFLSLLLILVCFI
ncbi:SNARE Fsv1 [Schizosaccharomyces cryophilus OY26]|uniref:SNARE Fsv1 n=1 Tax=Schizosaccharomyces cryophilus (strain OY26 / ATCC MYA-4695 / CBS 11777 / NBRC 106824 / NRRL Y48691) TaxID=653667 RepID=S9X1A3_SCHCR|nr:SNARE Fsv1 [Schizosaccharomyces cryophilus OY26]EPY50907.1 SNARE Fsv1 [Schizosaccharomyces cryophilus OY26]